MVIYADLAGGLAIYIHTFQRYFIPKWLCTQDINCSLVKRYIEFNADENETARDRSYNGTRCIEVPDHLIFITFETFFVGFLTTESVLSTEQLVYC